MIETNFSIFTDTATLAIFDLQSLKHRLDDTADWWSIEEDELDEVRRGNALFLNLGSDGAYKICVGGEFTGRTLFLNAPSGEIFIGAGEETTGDELEPTLVPSDQLAGQIVSLPQGCYAVKFACDGDKILLAFAPSQSSVNEIDELVRI